MALCLICCANDTTVVMLKLCIVLLNRLSEKQNIQLLHTGPEAFEWFFMFQPEYLKNQKVHLSVGRSDTLIDTRILLSYGSILQQSWAKPHSLKFYH